MKFRKVAIACFVFAAAAAAPGFSASHDDHGDGSMAVKGGPSMQMHSMMMKGMKEMPKPTGNMDRDFATMMRQHHQQALQMAQMELQHGKDPKMRDMAKKILDGQKQEIAEFDAWLKDSRLQKK